MSSTTNEQAIIISFQYNMEELDPLHELEDKLRTLLAGKNIGEVDGHEIAMDGSDGFLFLYGPNAEVLFKAIKPTLESTSFMIGAAARLRFGAVKTNASEIDVVIGEN